MSDRRRFQRRSGRLPSSPISDGWALTLTERDPQIPNLPLERIKPVKVCRLGRRHAAEPVITQVNPRGETMYWIGAAGPALDEAEGTDFHATEHGHVVMTPLKVDLTDHDHLADWARTATGLDATARGAG